MPITHEIVVNNSKWQLVLDAEQVIPDNPGEGTPAMVYGPEVASGTYFCVIDTGEITTSRGQTREVPVAVLDWLEGLRDAVEQITG